MIRSTPFRFAALLALGVGMGPVVAAAQSPEEPVRPIRHMGVGNVAFLNTWDPALHAGYMIQPAFTRTRVVTGEFGQPEVIPPQWYLHTLASMGWARDVDGTGETGLSGVGQLGVIRRLRSDGPIGIARVGVAAQGSWAPRGLGPVARIELFNGNLALSAGYMRFRAPREDGFVLNIDALRCILQDLGLVSNCGIL